jgi:hypothetical protein
LHSKVNRKNISFFHYKDFYRSNEVDFQTNSTTKFELFSMGAPELILSSIPTSSP